MCLSPHSLNCMTQVLLHFLSYAVCCYLVKEEQTMTRNECQQIQHHSLE